MSKHIWSKIPPTNNIVENPKYLLSIEDPIFTSDSYDPIDLGKSMTMNGLLQTLRIIKRAVFATKLLNSSTSISNLSSTSSSSSTSSISTSTVAMNNKQKLPLLFDKEGLIRLAFVGGYRTTTLPQPAWRFPFSLKSTNFKSNLIYQSESEKSMKSKGGSGGGSVTGGLLGGVLSNSNDSVSTNSSSALSSIPQSEINYFTSQSPSVLQPSSSNFNLPKPITSASASVGGSAFSHSQNNLRQMNIDQQQQQQQQQQRLSQKQQQQQQQKQQQPYGTHGVPDLALMGSQSGLGQVQGQGQGQNQSQGQGRGGGGGVGGYAGFPTPTSGFSSLGKGVISNQNLAQNLNLNQNSISMATATTTATATSKYGAVLNNSRLIQQQQRAVGDDLPIVSNNHEYCTSIYPFITSILFLSLSFFYQFIITFSLFFYFIFTCVVPVIFILLYLDKEKFYT